MRNSELETALPILIFIGGLLLAFFIMGLMMLIWPEGAPF